MFHTIAKKERPGKVPHPLNLLAAQRSQREHYGGKKQFASRSFNDGPSRINTNVSVISQKISIPAPKDIAPPRVTAVSWIGLNQCAIPCDFASAVSRQQRVHGGKDEADRSHRTQQ